MHHLELYMIDEAKSAQIRSRIKFTIHGEKNTQYILNLGKARVNVNVFDKLISQDGEILHNQESILNGEPPFIRKFISKLGNLTRF